MMLDLAAYRLSLEASMVTGGTFAERCWHA